MKSIAKNPRINIRWILLAGLAAIATMPAAAVIQPYTADSATLHLWHLDETSTPCVDAAPGGTNLTRMINGATLGNVSFSNSAVNFTNCISFGTLATAGAVIFPRGSGNVGTAIPFTYAGADGAFTLKPWSTSNLIRPTITASTRRATSRFKSWIATPTTAAPACFNSALIR